MAASERIFEILDTHSEVPERPDAPPLARLRQAIRVPQRQFYLRWRQQDNLKDVSFSVRAGQAVAIVGLSGASRRRSSAYLVPRSMT